LEYIKLKLKDKSGQDMVEFTFVLPLLLFCFAFLITGSQLIYNKFVTFDAAFHGLRSASTQVSHEAADKSFKEIAGTYKNQGIGVDEIRANVIANAWKKDAPISGIVVFKIKTLFPLTYDGFRAKNYYDIQSKTSTYVEYNTNLNFK
jgi:hypothetical protein